MTTFLVDSFDVSELRKGSGNIARRSAAASRDTASRDTVSAKSVDFVSSIITPADIALANRWVHPHRFILLISDNMATGGCIHIGNL